nr:dipeptidase [Novosphingobium huizhouense]
MLAIAAVGPAAGAKPTPSLHERLLTLDTHLDTPASLDLPDWSIADLHEGDYTQVDVPRMRQGGLDGGFWAIYTPQGPLDAASTGAARNFAFRRAARILEMVAANPRDFALADKAADAARIAGSGRRVVFLSIENAWPLGDDPGLIDAFHALGVRIAGFAHFKTNQFADSATDAARWDGLSPLGVQLLAQMNRVGVVPDLSHSSDAALADALRLSRTPIVLSHSGCRAVYDHPRNVSDDQLRALAAKGGVIQINSVYLHKAEPNPARTAAMEALEKQYPEGATLSREQRAAYLSARHEIDRRYPEQGRATFDMFMANLLHAIRIAGIDHVGIGADWDGGGGVVGMEDVASLPKITAALQAEGFSETDIAKVWSGNILRVLAEAEAEAAREGKPAA